ncbi:MAG: pyridoxal phosphate-dependent aminotransferase family protein [Candidatus Kapabacteria bacterium]|jgi:8-amino-7-oxononanoate synthase|nr:pyridoxal phosphate-dependent aminotransferase family protein [Candidatus Kapabacteria bacterium]
MDIFKKCFNWNLADKIKKKGLYPYFREIQENEGPVVTIEGKERIMAGSNNYLGLTAHPKVREAAIAAVNKYGTGCSGSRYLTGTLDLHVELEARLAEFLGFESVLLYSTGYQTALGIIPTIAQRGDYIVSDKENHACIMNGAMIAKGALTNFVRYKHNDMEDLERVLAGLPEKAGKFIVSDGVFSVTGEIVNLPELLKIAKKFGVRVMIDDAHSLGVIGEGGRGTASHFGLTEETDMVMGTFSKTLSSLGGYVAGPERVINYLKHHSSALIFSASPTPSSCAATLAALQILKDEPERVGKLLANTKYLRKGLMALGFNIIQNETAIVPVIIGDLEKAFLVWRKLFDYGVFVNAFIPPAVPPNMSMMRVSMMASLTEDHLNKIIDVFGKVGKEVGML